MTTQDLQYIPEDTSELAGVVYGLHLGDYEYRYIGQTKQFLKERVRQHLGYAKRNKHYAVSRWIKKHGPENIRVCVLATVTKEELHLLDDLEIFYIAQYRDLIEEKNLNLNDGGSGNNSGGKPGWKHTDEAKRKISESKIGIKRPPEVGLAISLKMRGRTPHNKGVPRPSETRAKISASLKANKNRVCTPPQDGRSLHTRWHVNRDLFKEGCFFCDEEILFNLVLA